MTLHSPKKGARGRAESAQNWWVGIERNRSVTEVKAVFYVCLDSNEIIVHNNTFAKMCCFRVELS